MDKVRHKEMSARPADKLVVLNTVVPVVVVEGSPFKNWDTPFLHSSKSRTSL